MQAITSKLNLVDLAGSERVRKTKSVGTVLREAGQINKSLSILEQVIIALSERQRDHIPYRYYIHPSATPHSLEIPNLYYKWVPTC